MSEPGHRIVVIVPAYNESGNIGQILDELRALPLSLDIVVIDDGSVDDTRREAAAKEVPVLSLPFNLGIGGAVQTGFQYACRYGYDYAVQVDGDGQHDVRYLEKILTPVLNGEVDIAVGSRFLHPFTGYRSSAVRRIGIHFFAGLISFLTHSQVTDPTSGFRAFSRRAIEAFADDYPVDFPEPESIVVADQMGLTLKEFPVEMRRRGHGQSSIRYFSTLYYMVKVTFAILLIKIKRRKADV